MTILEQTPIRAVAFDMDGLMFNTEDLYVEVGSAVLRRRGREPSRAVFDRMMGRPSALAIQILIDHFQLADTVDALECESDAMFRELLPRKLAPLPGLVSLLDFLDERSIPRAIGTGSRRKFVEYALSLTGLASRFDFVVTSEDVDRGKPAPDTFLRIGERYGVASRELLVLEDSHNGCQAGIAAEARVIAVPSEHTRHHDFSGVELVADSLHDVRIRDRIQGF